MTRPNVEEVRVADLIPRCQALVDDGGRMQMAYAWCPDKGQAIELRYLVYPRVGEPFRIWRCRPQGETVHSLASIAPLLSWYEREITDLFGLHFEAQPVSAPLALLPGTRSPQPPLLPGAEAKLDCVPVPYRMPEIAGPDGQDIQRLPFGPIRADVFESAQFVFYYVGESILYYHPQLFFKHRGMEKRFEGTAPELGMIFAERVSAVGGVAHALAYCRAIEAASDCVVPSRAEGLRVVLAELERLYNHLHYLGHLAHTTTLKVGEAQGKYLEEFAKQINARVSGSRFLRSVLVPGGVRRELRLEQLDDALDAIHRDFTIYARMLEASTTHLDRLITTGVLDKKLSFDQGATGPVERACGWDRDLRRDQAYADYARLPLEVTVREAGDAHARQQVRIAEIDNSIALLRAQLKLLEPGPIRVSCTPPPGSEGVGWAESPRGSLFYAIHLDEAGRLARVKIKSPSFSNWRAFAFTVHESNMMDYAINEASFGLTIAGCDR